MVVVVPKTGALPANACRSVPEGAFMSSTMMVMATARMPSEKASIRPLVIGAIR